MLERTLSMPWLHVHASLLVRSSRSPLRPSEPLHHMGQARLGIGEADRQLGQILARALQRPHA